MNVLATSWTWQVSDRVYRMAIKIHLSMPLLCSLTLFECMVRYGGPSFVQHACWHKRTFNVRLIVILYDFCGLRLYCAHALTK